MKHSRYKTELKKEVLNNPSRLESADDLQNIETSKRLKYNYIGFFVVYFTLSSITVYLTIYLPVYLLSILNVNRSDLAFIQIFSYSVLFLAPFLGFLFDKFPHYKKLLLNCSILLFLLSSFATLLTGKTLYIFGIFLALNLLSHEIIKVGMGKILIESAQNEEIKDKILIIINTSSNIGGFIPSIVFTYAISNIFNLDLWTNFFLFGGISILPILIALYCIDHNYTPQIKSEKPIVIEKHKKENYYQILFLTLSFIMIWSDKLYQFPFTPWILFKFGQNGLKTLSSSYGFFLILNTFGYIIGQKISKKFKRKNIILMMNFIYICLSILMTFSNLFFLLIIYALNSFVSGIMLLNYTSLIISFSKNVKYRNASYQMLRFAVAIASVIFIPLGTFLSSSNSTEIIILLAGFLSIFSLVPIFFIKS